MSTAYCTINDLENRLSIEGVGFRIDDCPPTALGDVIDDASSTVDLYTLLKYSETGLAGCRRIKHLAADIGCYLLCERRGNPVPIGIASKFDRAMAELEKIQAGSLKLPDVPRRKGSVPSMSNVRVISTSLGNHAVVQKHRSTAVPEGFRQNTDPWDQLGLNSLPDYVI